MLKMEQRFFMEVHQNYFATLDYDFAEEKVYKRAWKKVLFTTLAFLYQDYVIRNVYSERGGKHTNYGGIFISILEHLDLIQLTTFCGECMIFTREMHTYWNIIYIK